MRPLAVEHHCGQGPAEDLVVSRFEGPPQVAHLIAEPVQRRRVPARPGRARRESVIPLKRYLWAEVPLCNYRCHFCQFPILVLGSRPGSVPPLAAAFTARPESVPGIEAALTPGSTVALVSPPGATADGWPGACGKTQLAAHLAENLWEVPGLDVLAWVDAGSRASVLAGYQHAAARLGLDDGVRILCRRTSGNRQACRPAQGSSAGC